MTEIDAMGVTNDGERRRKITETKIKMAKGLTGSAQL